MYECELIDKICFYIEIVYYWPFIFENGTRNEKVYNEWMQNEFLDEISV